MMIAKLNTVNKLLESNLNLSVIIQETFEN